MKINTMVKHKYVSKETLNLQIYIRHDIIIELKQLKFHYHLVLENQVLAQILKTEK